MVTQLQLVDRIRSLGNSHKMIQDVRYGFLTDVDDLPDFNPPVLYIIPQAVTVPRDGIFRFSFNLLCFDMLLQDKQNFDDVISDTSGYLIDIYTELLYNSGDTVESWGLQTGTSITPFQERFKDYVAGNTMTVFVDIFQSNCTNDLPFD